MLKKLFTIGLFAFIACAIFIAGIGHNIAQNIFRRQL
jgi:hypothetical protein